jgi:hypothetical protein
MLKNYIISEHDEAVEIIDTIISKSSDDETALREITHEINNNPKKYKPYLRSIRTRERQIMTFNVFNRMPNIHRYVDYGCGDASVTKSMADRLNLTPENIIGVDIHNNPPAGITYVHNLHDIATESIDFITAYVSLHHVKNVDEVLDDISRVASKGGLFIIREHDFDSSPTMRAYLHLIHMYSDIKNSDKCDIDEIISADYRSMTTWQSMIVSRGFTHILTITYHGNNPQRLCTAYFQKQQGISDDMKLVKKT